MYPISSTNPVFRAVPGSSQQLMAIWPITITTAHNASPADNAAFEWVIARTPEKWNKYILPEGTGVFLSKSVPNFRYAILVGVI